MQQLFYFYRCSVWGGMGRVMVTRAPPPSALPISKVPPWCAMRSSPATGLGGALVEFLLDVGQLLDRDAGAEIGLAVCDEIMRLHNGTFDIANASGGGAVVTMTLPMEK